MQTESAPDHANVKPLPPIVIGILLASGIALEIVSPFLIALPAGLRLFGLALSVASVAFIIYCAKLFMAAGTALPPNAPTTAMVTHGPYRYSRNPIYLAMFVFIFGLSLALNNVWFLAALILFAAYIFLYVIPREEAYLERKFGETYLSYKDRVRRFL